jgi:hypothetical protein
MRECLWVCVRCIICPSNNFKKSYIFFEFGFSLELLTPKNLFWFFFSASCCFYSSKCLRPIWNGFVCDCVSPVCLSIYYIIHIIHHILHIYLYYLWLIIVITPVSFICRSSYLSLLCFVVRPGKHRLFGSAATAYMMMCLCIISIYCGVISYWCARSIWIF